MSISIQAGWLNGTVGNQNVGGTGKGQEKGNVFGGNLNLANDPVAQRRKEAQEQAWKIVKNAWDNDREVDESVRLRRDHYTQMEQLKKEAVDQLADVNEDKEALQKLYEVPDDSQEQQDLLLLEKEQDYKNGVTHERLTEEEQERLAEIQSKPLTEYQERALELNDQAGNYKIAIADADRRMRDDTADIHRIGIERLKSNPMVEAQEAAEEIYKVANEEIIGMLISEAREHIDEKLEEAEEKAEKAMEEKEEREEQLDEIKLNRAVQEALIEGTKEAVEKAEAEARRSETPDIEIRDMVDMVKGKNPADDVGASLDEIKSSMKLLEADLKGIKVDEEV